MPAKKLKELLQLGALRSLKQRENLIDLTSNDYLGLSRNSLLQQEIISCWEKWSKKIPQQIGATGSRLLTGNHVYFEEIEEKIAKFHGFPAATLFNCGYMANLSLLSAICSEGDVLIIDAQAHASFHDGRRLSNGQTFYFRHNDLNHLEARLKIRSRNRFVVIESLYSMSGDYAPLPEIAKLCEKYDAYLIVDEAHAIGVLGPQGKGLVAQHGLENKVFACIFTFGKALGVHGAAIAGPSLLKKIFINYARPFIYTTALPLSSLAGIACSYRQFPSMAEERKRIENLCSSFQFHSFIHPISIPGRHAVQLASQFLAHRGFDVRPIVSPTVPKGEERLRLTVHSHNTIEQIAQCLNLISHWRLYQCKKSLSPESEQTWAKQLPQQSFAKPWKQTIGNPFNAA